MQKDFAFEMGTSNLRFGPGATREVGMDLSELGARRVMLLTDPNLVELPPVRTVVESLASEGVEYALFDRVRVEPTDVSFQEAIDFALEGDFDAFVGGGAGVPQSIRQRPRIYIPPIPMISTRT